MKKKIVWLPYDFDTAIGINNEGALVFDYSLEDTDHLAGGADVYNGQDSVLWNNLRDAFPDELMEMYRSLRSSGKLSYAVVEKMFEEHQGKWPEAIFNEDAFFKYIAPLVDDGTASYLAMAQGSKAEQRKWWLYNRFRYIDSKYNAGDALTDVIQIRGYAKSDVTVTPYADIYPAVKYGSYLVRTRGKRNQPFTLACPLDKVNDTEIYIYSASQLASVGDLSGFKVGFADFSMATRLQSIKVGDGAEGYENPNLTELTVGNNALLGTVDARKCTALGGVVDLSGAVNIEHALFDGTAVTSVSLPVGGILKTLHLPDTVTNLTVRNQAEITDFTMAGFANVTTLRVENSPAIPVGEILASMAPNSRVRIIGFEMTVTDTEEVDEFFDFLDTMRGLDEAGNNLDRAVVGGVIHGLGTVSASWLADAKSRYPEITIEYEHISAQLKYYDYNGSNLLNTETILDGGNGTYTGRPGRSSTAQYSYAFAGWSTEEDQYTADANAVKSVTADRNVYAAYTRTVRTYTVTWKNSNGTTLETDTNVLYGSTPQYNGSTPANPDASGGSFKGWTPEISTVTGDMTYTASYKPKYSVGFYNGSTLLDTVTVVEGGTAAYSGTTPVDPDGGDFLGWAASSGQHEADASILKNITANKSVYAAFTKVITVEVPTAKSAAGAYGVEWNYANRSLALTRLGLASSFADPAPATALDGTGTSPFDTISPWKDMKRYNIIDGAVAYSQDDAGFSETDYDTVVYIPEFYYTAQKDTENSKWLWAISPTPIEGYVKHQGSGRYVGRFHTSGDSSAVYSKSGVAPLVNKSLDNFRTYHHNKGEKWYTLDIATWSALQMLYLVEFANFHSQSMLGNGHSTNSAGSTGGTTGASYHTLKRSSADNMYRWVENPFSQVYDWVDGVLTSAKAVYTGVDNDRFTSAVSSLSATSITLLSSGYITGFGYSEECPYALIPDAASGGSSTTYVPDYVYSGTGTRGVFVGGNYYSYDNYGFFYFNAFNSPSYTDTYLGSRLLFIP